MMVMINVPSEIANEFFACGTIIGYGFYGAVLILKEKCKNDTNSQMLYAMKILRSPADKTSKKNIETEIRILSQIDSPYTVHLKRNIEENNQVYLIMEYCENGELDKAINDRAAVFQPFEEDEIWKYFIQICLGLECLHSNKIIHRDIKPQNIFLDKNRDIKIGDFGLSRYEIASAPAGTFQYHAPEIWNNNNKPSYESDIWALGCVLYQMCNFEIPFNGDSMKIQFEQHEPIRDQYSDDLRFIVDWCLEKEKSRRPTITNLLEREIIAKKIISLGINIPNTSILWSKKDEIKRIYEQQQNSLKNRQPSSQNFRNIHSIEEEKIHRLNHVGISNYQLSNSAIQILANIPKFVNLVSKSNSNVFKCLLRIFNIILSNGHPSRFKSYIDNFTRELNQKYPMIKNIAIIDCKELYNILIYSAFAECEEKNLFLIKQHKLFVCEKGHEMTKEEQQLFLIIPPNKKLDTEKCIQDIKEKETELEIYCQECGYAIKTKILTESLELPEYLVFYITDTTNQGRVPKTYIRSDEKEYDLFGVICYCLGYYISFILNENRRWIKYNAYVVEEDPDYNRAYMLFYKQR